VNASIPHTELLIRKEFLYDGRQGHGEYVEALAFGVASLSGRALGFHCLLRNGAQIGRLPVHALCTKPCEPIPLDVAQVWDCFSYDVEVVEYEWLEGARCAVYTKERKWVWGTYLFTVDWYGSAAAEAAGDTGWKCAHLIEADSGHLLLQPNNRTRWTDSSWVTEPFPERPDYLTQSQVWKCENGSKWAAEERMFYGVGGDS